MFVKIIKSELDTYWYKAGEIHKVELRTTGWFENYPNYFWKVGTEGHGIHKDDCVEVEIIRQPFDHNFENFDLATLEKYAQDLQDCIIERKKFSQKDYDKVVATLRSSKGRVPFAADEDIWYMEVHEGKLDTDLVGSFEWGLFQVYFDSSSSMNAAIAKAGKENILKAVKFEQEIGL